MQEVSTSAYHSPSFSHHHIPSSHLLSPQRHSARLFCAVVSNRTQEPQRNTDDHQHNGHLVRIGRARQLLVDALGLCFPRRTVMAAITVTGSKKKKGRGSVLLQSGLVSSSAT